MRRLPHKILLIAKRDYLAAIQTKAFLIGLVIAPILFGGGVMTSVIAKRRPDIRPRRIAVLDHTGVAAGPVIASIQRLNQMELHDPKTGHQVMPEYSFETIASDPGDPNAQRLELSQRVRNGELFGFLEIGPGALHPTPAMRADPAAGLTWYSSEGGVGEVRQWLAAPVNDALRRIRLAELGVDKSRFNEVLANIGLQGMDLVSRDARTGQFRTGKRDYIGGTAVPVAMALLLTMIVIMTSAPMLPAIAQDKMQRVHEMLLASATPSELIRGKVLAAIWQALTTAAVYLVGAPLALKALDMSDLMPVHLLPWLIVYLIAEVTILSAMAAALGAACGSPQDAQSLNFVLIAPVIVPLIMLSQVIQQPGGSLATGLSLFPLFTPIVMLIRQASPGGVPAWQPWVGLAGVVLVTTAITWLAARVFRIGILMQGKAPRVSELVRWAVRG
ncbi:MAG: ABC transporter permease [Acidobacteriia bacterium]|nr:ABC transporter permease [Terriglobia bacterium]